MYAHTLLTSPTPWLSVLLPVHGVEHWLPACARSLLTQDLQGVELVFLDDASPDGSAAYLEALAAEHPGRIRLLRHPENRGTWAGRNTLLAEARGEWLWFVDPDDLVEPGAVARLRDIVGRHQPDLVMCDFRAFEDGRVASGRDRHVSTFRGRRGALATDRDALLRGMFQEGKFHLWTKVVRRTAWPAALRFEGAAFHDLRLVARLALHVRSWYHAPEVWVSYRQRAGSIQGAMTPAKLERWMEALERYGAELGAWEVPASPATRAAVADYAARALMSAGRTAEQLEPAGAEDRLRRWGALWRSASALTGAELERCYWLRGRVRRALRWRRWRRRAGV